FPPTITIPRVCDRSGVLDTEGRLTCRTHFTRVTATLVTTRAAGLPTASFAATATSRVPVPSVPEGNAPPEKSAGKVKFPVAASNVTVHVVTPLMVHFPAAGSGPLPWSFGVEYVSLTVNFNVYLVSPERQKWLPSWPQNRAASATPPLQSAFSSGYVVVVPLAPTVNVIVGGFPSMPS